MSNAVNFSNTTPPAPAGKQSVTFQADTGNPPNISAYVPVPDKTSQLTNDSGFLTAAPVVSVAGKTGAVTLQPSDIGAASLLGDNAFSGTQSLAGPLVSNNGVAVNFKAANNGFIAQRIYSDGNGGLAIDSAASANAWVASLKVAGSGAVTISQPQVLSFGANWQPWTPTPSFSGSMTASNIGYGQCDYLRIGPVVFLRLYVYMVLGGAMSNTVYFPLPAASVNPGSPVLLNAGMSYTNGWQPTFSFISGGQIALYPPNGSSSNFVAGGWNFLVEGQYRCA